MLSDSQKLIIVGCNHEKTPIEVRERMALSPDELAGLHSRLREEEEPSEAAVLHTCNRVEIYAVTNRPAWNLQIADLFQSINGFPASEFLEHAYVLEDVEAVKHAYRVASGLDSQMVGETQILGQMKDAYAAAISHETVGPTLHRFFQKAFQAAKWARSETHIGSGHISLGNVAVELATRIFGKLTVSRTLLVGSGQAGQDVAKAFRSRGVACMSIASRTHERAEALARQVDGLIIPYKIWEESLPYIDIGIFATSAKDVLLTRDMIERRLGKRPRKPLFLMDLAVPRDIEGTVSKMPNVYLYNLGDLAGIANENLASRQREVDLCLQELDSRAHFLWDRMRTNGHAVKGVKRLN